MILCCGEALIDMIPAPLAAGGTGFAPLPGGAVFNTAIALGRLGVSVGLLSGVSRDLFGEQLAQALSDSHVDGSALIRSDRPTTLAFVQLVEGQARYSFFDEASAGRMLTPADMPAIPDRVEAMFFGGISLAVEPGAEAYAALLAREASRRAIMIDPNIRAGFIADPARYRTRMMQMLGRADLVKLSDEDLDWLITEGTEIADKARAILALGPRCVIITRGAQGATGYLAQGEPVTIPAQAAQVVDTVGAGDSFNSGVLAALARQGLLSKPALAQLTRDQLADALSFGARVAAVTVSRAGANPPWAKELMPKE